MPDPALTGKIHHLISQSIPAGSLGRELPKVVINGKWEAENSVPTINNMIGK